MSYIYDDIKNAKIGSVVQYIEDISPHLTTNKCYYVVSDGMIIRDDGQKGSCSLKEKAWKLIKTKPGAKAEIGDTVIVIANKGSLAKIGSTHTVTNKNSTSVLTMKTNGKYTDFLVLCTKEPKVRYYKNL